METLGDLFVVVFFDAAHDNKIKIKIIQKIPMLRPSPVNVKRKGCESKAVRNFFILIILISKSNQKAAKSEMWCNYSVHLVLSSLSVATNSV